MSSIRTRTPSAASAAGTALLLCVFLGVLAAPGWADDEEEIPIVELPPVDVIADPLNEEVQTASPVAPTTVFEAWAPAVALSERQLQKRIQPTVGEMLGSLPGMSSTYFGPGASRPVIRGLQADRIRVLDGGLGTLDVSQTSPDHAVAYEPLQARRVEVIRGPATLRYGTTAIGGVVNLIDSRIPRTPIGRAVRAVLDARYRTGDNERAGFLEVEGQRGPWNWHADGFVRRTDDMTIPGYARSERLRRLDAEEGELDPGPKDTLPNSDIRSEGARGGLSNIGRWGYVGGAFDWYSTNYGIPSGGHAHGHEDEDHDDDHDDDDHADEDDDHDHEHAEDVDIRIDLRRFRGDLRGRFCLGGCLRHLDWALGYVDYEHVELEGNEVGTRFVGRGFEGRTELVHRPIRGWEGALGLQLVVSDLEAEGEEAFLPPSTTYAPAIFLFEERDLDGRNAIQLGARYDYQQIDSDAGDRDFHAVSGSVGWLYKPRSDVVLATTLAYTQRPPTSTELFADGPHVAVQRVEIGDPDLSNEKSLGLDVGLRRDGRRWSAAISGFYNHFFDFIDLVPTGEVEDGFLVERYEQSEARFYGGELRGAWHALRGPSHYLDIRFMADYVHAETVDAGDPLPRIPPLRLGTGATWRSGRWEADAELWQVFDQDRVAPFELPTDGYTMLDAGLAYDFCLLGGETTVFLRGTNLLDQEARVHSSFLKDVVPLMGRALTVGLRSRF